MVSRFGNKNKNKILEEFYFISKQMLSKDSEEMLLKSNNLFRNQINTNYITERNKVDNQTNSNSFISSNKGYSHTDKDSCLPTECSLVLKKKSIKSLSLQKYINYDYYHPKTVDRRMNSSHYQSPNDSHRNKSPLTSIKYDDSVNVTPNHTQVNIGISSVKNEESTRNMTDFKGIKVDKSMLMSSTSVNKLNSTVINDLKESKHAKDQSLVQKCKNINSFDSPEKIKKKFYCSCAPAKDFKFACSSGQGWIQNCFKVYNYEWNLETYEDLTKLSSNPEIVSEETEIQIKKDLFRTFQKIDLFASINMKEKLMRVLKNLVAYDPCNGYTQGMNFIAAALIIHCEESVTFWLCTGLLEEYEIRDVYSSEFSGMYKHINVFSTLLEKHQPEIYQRFSEVEVLPEMYMSEWILSFMCAYIPLNWLSKYFDLFFKHGWIAFYAISLSIHEFLKESILNEYDMPEVLMCMKIMKENRESIHLNTQDNKCESTNLGPSFSNLSIQAYSDNDCFSVSQRTKNEDWKSIFEGCNKYIELLAHLKI